MLIPTDPNASRQMEFKFLINGDPFYSGLTIVTHRDRVNSFRTLIFCLSKRLPVSTNIPNGVRRIYSLETLKQVKSLSELRTGAYYVCSGFERLKHKKFLLNDSDMNRAMADNRFDLNVVLEWNAQQRTEKYSGQTKRMVRTKEMRLGQNQTPTSRLITILEYGPPPQAKMSMILTKAHQTIEGFDRLLFDIAHYFGKKHKRGRIQGTLYSSKGKVISRRDDLSASDSALIFVPLNYFPKLRVIRSMLISIFSDGPYVNQITNCWSRVLQTADTPSVAKSPHRKRPRDPNANKGEDKQRLPPISNKSLRIDSFMEANLKHRGFKFSKTKRKYVFQGKEGNLPKLVKSPIPRSTEVQAKKRPEVEPAKPAAVMVKRPSKLPDINETVKKSNFSDNYILGSKIGDGNFAAVHKATKIATGGIFAVKIIDKLKYVGKETLLRQELNILAQCRHENIVKLFEIFHTAKEVFIVTELAELGDLFDHIKSHSKFKENESAEMVKDIASALFYLHSRQIAHRDVKPENILIYRRSNGRKSLKLADFGLAIETKYLVFTVCGTPTYVAPEILNEVGYGIEVDMWALGVIAYIFMVGFPPFRSPHGGQTQLFELIKKASFSFQRPHWDGIGESAKNLISHLLRLDRHKRFKAIDVLCHPWILSKGDTVELPDQLSVLRSRSRLHLEREALKASQFRLIQDTTTEI